MEQVLMGCLTLPDKKATYQIAELGCDDCAGLIDCPPQFSLSFLLFSSHNYPQS